MRDRPANAFETMMASKCAPSPRTSTCSQGSPLSSEARMDSGVTMIFSVAQFIAAGEQHQGEHGQGQGRGGDDGETRHRRNIRHAEKAVAETVDHVEKRV